eukprot:CAMPEP_0173404560 /NCGR_PEP_ID=MMETSP1356-20130122/59695_1 /TAXON_ID=77927 ORGANISM="Hemiselmis virescens, Strain PCC157" /NCGR_SAMPLE_ID=MMETSP1356 /ASSEMBLY_ACC=CAM_ASM_000847 /LENGTH=70 /DNA_ID=CAMNT_0014365257 /DNA_START=336 /DNA_END=545 /DNA_ORIENTATION=+
MNSKPARQLEKATSHPPTAPDRLTLLFLYAARANSEGTMTTQATCFGDPAMLFKSTEPLSTVSPTVLLTW